MPFETPQAAPAPTRRSSRLRNEAVEAPAVGTTAAAFAAPNSLPATTAPSATVLTSRRAARQQVSVQSVDASSTPLLAPAAPVESPAESPTAESPTDETMSDEDVDVFEQATRAFRIGEQTADAAASVPRATEEHLAEPTIPHVAPRRSYSVRRFVTIGATVGVMSLAGLLAVSMTLPTEAVAAAQAPQAAAVTSLVTASKTAKDDAPEGEIQAYVASSDVQNESLERAEDFSTVSYLDIAAEQGIRYSGEVYTNDPDAAIQWPFLVGVGMTYGYGMRDGRLHAGIDFVPGNGAPIQAIADGTVRTATEQGGGYGVTVYIDHIIDGAVITSHYAHMQYGSLRVKAGDTVKVGDIVGLTGDTGNSYGAHLHFELIVNGSTIDPMPWMKENAGRSSY
ncbi:peptidoglycan DD-metalloendopeptidase family protein [Microbacterium sp. LWH12-1.2]|uniref:peptidoglycan DD-metalloendopeptidase family protein n=1 Tax=Microbacterium sp. LWH12-1.2 TaxID=3135259 RepID=UPI003446CE60